MPKLLSFLIPSRDRVSGLEQAIDSINATTHQLDQVEMLIKFDSDDKASISQIDALTARAKFDVDFLIDERLGGYINLHTFVNKMAQKALGEWLWLFNDDAIISTPGWDTVLRELPTTFPALTPRQLYMAVIRCSYPYTDGRTDRYNDNNIFPIVQKTLTDLIGHYSLTMYNDAYIDMVGQKAGTPITLGWCPKERVVKQPEIIVTHTMVHDVVRKESEVQYQWQPTPEERARLDRETVAAWDKVKAYLNEGRPSGQPAA